MPTPAPLTVAVTGSSGYLGRLLLSRLAEHPGVGRVIGIDLVEPPATTRNLEFYRMDIRSPDLHEVMRAADVVAHLAFVHQGDHDEMRETNVGGIRLVLEAAVRADVRKIVVRSSTMAYGAHADNDFPLLETSPLRPAPGVAGSAHHAEVEEVVRSFVATHHGLRVAVLRFAPVLGPTVDPSTALAVAGPHGFSVRGYEPPVQAVHEDDAARALLVAAVTDLEGTYNVCAADRLDPAEVDAIWGRRRVEIEADRAHLTAERLLRLRMAGPGPAMLPFLMYPWVASNAKLVATGFSFERSTADALREGAEASQGWVVVGPLRFRPKRLALVGGAVAAVALGGAVRRRATRRST